MDCNVSASTRLFLLLPQIVPRPRCLSPPCPHQWQAQPHRTRARQHDQQHAQVYNAKSVLTNDYRLTLETLNQFKNGAISSHTNKPDKVGNSPVKKRTHTATSSLAKVINMETVDQAQSSSASKPELRRWKRWRRQSRKRGLGKWASQVHDVWCKSKSFITSSQRHDYNATGNAIIFIS